MPLLRRPSFQVVLATKDQNTITEDDVAVDDNSSVSSLQSTFTAVDQVTCKFSSPQQQLPLNRRSVTKAVRFDESVNTVHTNTNWHRGECHRTWYTTTELRECKVRYVQMAREIHRSERVNTAKHSYQRVVLAAYDACCRTMYEVVPSASSSPLEPDERYNLRRWMTVGVSRLGLERVCIREISMDRSNRRAHVVDAVLDAQDQHAQDEVLRQISLRISRPSRLFAHEVARAQQSTTLSN